MLAEPTLHRPRSVEEVLALLDEHGDDAKLVAGGTAFMILSKLGLLHPEHVICCDLDGLAGVEVTDAAVRLGAATRLRDLERHPQLRAALPVLTAAIGLVANLRVRNVATIGGNLAEADPSSDPPAVLTALGARARARSLTGERWIPLTAFFQGFYETALLPTELLDLVEIPRLGSEWHGQYHKFVSRTQEDRTCVGVAAFAAVAPDNTCAGLRVCVIGLQAAPLRLEDVEAAALGRPLDADLGADVAAAYVTAAEPISDSRGSASYRLRAAAASIRRAIAAAARGADDAVLT